MLTTYVFDVFLSQTTYVFETICAILSYELEIICIFASEKQSSRNGQLDKILKESII